MKIFKILISAVAALVIFSSCQQNESNLPVYKEVITKSNLLEIVNQIETSEEVDSEELQLFSAGIARLGVKDSLAGLSVGEVIAMQREFQRKQAVDAISTSAPRVELVMNHTFKYVGIAPKDDGKEPLNVIVYEVTNKSDKEMVDIQGGLQFVTPRDNKLVKLYPVKSKVMIEKNGPIKPGETRRLALPFQHVDTSVRDSIVRNIQGLKHLWQPLMIEFSDGTKITTKRTDNQ